MKTLHQISYVFLLIGFACAPLHAADTQVDTALPSAESADGHGAGTRQWLEMQRSGQSASPNKQTLSGPAMKKIHDKYIDGFSQPVPDLAIENAKDSR